MQSSAELSRDSVTPDRVFPAFTQAQFGEPSHRRDEEAASPAWRPAAAPPLPLFASPPVGLAHSASAAQGPPGEDHSAGAGQGSVNAGSGVSGLGNPQGIAVLSILNSFTTRPALPPGHDQVHTQGILPRPWTSEDIGNVGLGGSAIQDRNTYTV